MKVNVMELHETGDLSRDTTLLMVNEETLITVKGFGTGEYRWKVADAASGEKADLMAHLFDAFSAADIDPEGFWPGEKTLGKGLVWAEPITFAHVVSDLIKNQ